MVNHKDPRLEALEQGRPYTWTVSDGGNLASMRAAIKHGQTLTLSPVTDSREVQVGDIVYLKWHKGHMMHLVQEIQGDQFLIANSVGKINGWVSGSDILGRITQVIEPEARPSLPQMLSKLEEAFYRLIEREHPAEDDTHRLLGIVDDMRWYADKIGIDRCFQQPQQNKWSFEQNLWHLAKLASLGSVPANVKPIAYFIDRGKECVGLAAEIYALFEYEETDW